MSKKKTHEDYVKELFMINSNIECLEEYINAKTPILHKCKIDGHEWYAKPNNILSGKGCPKCATLKTGMRCKKTQEEYILDVLYTNPNIEVIGKYVDANTKILHRCKKHNIEWNIRPHDVLQGKGCYLCKSEKIKFKKTKSHQKYVEELLRKNIGVKVIEKYKGQNIPILHKCQKDGFEFYVKPVYVLQGTFSCPKCKETSGERQIRQWLECHNIKYIYQMTFNDCKDIRLLPFDFYLPDFNIIVEYDHKQHYEPIEHFGGQESFEYTVKHDKIKNEYCKNNGILLLRIPYYKNVEEELNNFLFI